MNSIVQLAGTLPRDRTFREFVTSFTEGIELVTEDEAAQFIRYVCEVKSRNELATDAFAEQRFHLIRKSYIAWRNERTRKH